MTLNNLTLHMYDSPPPNVGSQIADLTAVAKRTSFETDIHGFSVLRTFIEVDSVEAFRIYDLSPSAHLVAMGRGEIAWEGRVEDRRMVERGVTLTAFGYWNALTDLPYTAWWNSTDLRYFFPLSAEDKASGNPDMFVMRKDDRLHTGLKKNETYTTGPERGRWALEIPEGSRTFFESIKFEYEVFLETNYQARMIAGASGISAAGTIVWTVTGNGASQTATVTVDIAASVTDANWFMFEVHRFSGSNTNAFDSGERFATFKMELIRGDNGSQVAGLIIPDIIAYVNEVNPGQLSTFDQIADPATLTLNPDGAVYLDVPCNEVIMDIVEHGEDPVSPNVGIPGSTRFMRVLENRVLRTGSTHPSVSGGAWQLPQEWAADVNIKDLSSSLATLVNSGYPVYQDERGRRKVGATYTDDGSVRSYGITKRLPVFSRKRDLNDADGLAERVVAEGKDLTVRASIEIINLVNTHGGEHPPWAARAGDIITIRNLGALGRGLEDRFTSFHIVRSVYNVDTGKFTVQPSFQSPTIAAQVGASWNTPALKTSGRSGETKEYFI